MNNIKIEINQLENIDWILEAATDLSHATEADLQAMKGKKWYHRLLDMISFSKDNQIQIARDIGSVAKLQEIVIRILVLLSQENAELSAAVKQQAELLSGLSCNDMALLNAIKKIKFGGTAQIDFSDLSRERKVLIASLLIMADATEQQNESSRKYFGSILTLANTTSFDNTVKPNAVDSLNREEQELLYRMIMIGRHLLEVPFEKGSEVLDWVSINQNRKKDIQQSILGTAAVVTPDFFISYYEKTAESFDRLSDEGILLGAAEETKADDKNESTDHPKEEPVKEQPSQEQNDKGKHPQRKKNTELSEMVKSAEAAVNVAVATATTTCAVPIPFADAPILIGEQVTLMALICKIFKINIKKDGLKALAYAAFGVSGATLIGKTVATGIIKMIPGVGSVTGGVISAGTAGVVTYAMGNAFIDICKAIKSGKLKEDEIATSKGKKMFAQLFSDQLKQKTPSEISFSRKDDRQ